MLEDIKAAIPLGFVLSFVIGPVFFILLETSAVKGFRAAISFNIGVVISDILFILIAYFSSFQLLENLSNQPGLFVFGGVILLVYGITTFFKKEVKEKKPKINLNKDYLSLLVKGFLLNFINIGVLAFWLVIVIGVSPSLNNDSSRILTFFSTMLVTYFITDIFKILLAKQLKRKLTPKRIILMKKGLGIILIICGIVLITKGFLPKDKLNIERGIENIRN